MHRNLIWAAPLLVALIPGPGAAQDRLARTDAVLAAQEVANYEGTVETIAIEIRQGSETIWTGTLRVGPQYGNANFSQSISEFAAPCPHEPLSRTSSNSNYDRINFSISRNNWMQEPDSFNINVNRMTPLPACEGEGTNTIGFSRVIDLPKSRPVTVSGEGGLTVRLTRSP